MTKTYRQAQILKLIDAQPIRTQEELSAALGKIGIDVTQVTLSRDIRELGLIKGHKGYQSTEEAAPPQEAAAALRRAVAAIVSRYSGPGPNTVRPSCEITVSLSDGIA